MHLQESITKVHTREDLAAFVHALRADLDSNRDEWENASLERFLNAMEHWILSLEGYYRNTGQPIPDQPSWKTFADILLASKIYE